MMETAAPPNRPLKRGWTTGSCATAAARAAYELLITGSCPAMVEIALPGGRRVSFAVAMHDASGASATAGIVKDAGDDPDVTHGAVIRATVQRADDGSGIAFRAGPGVGTVTKPGLPLPPGEPAINPVPRAMITAAIDEAATLLGATRDIIVEISIPGGEELAKKTLNPRLGIVGGLSILGTTGIVVPFSCAAWIHSIYRGVDVARAAGLPHIAGATGSMSEKAVQQLHGLPETALIDMGDFAGGMLKYLRRHPLPRVTVAGGFAKMTKLGQGLLDLHSRAGEVDLDWLANTLRDAGAPDELVTTARNANTALQVLQDAQRAGFSAGDIVAQAAWHTAHRALGNDAIALDVAVFDRDGRLVGQSRGPDHSPLPRKRR
ncbi:cobalt-precorrin-5B (C(1))-methyltransferase [Bradyrhizobium ontarionense]|uniref:Cobalt-precorrin-5B C(1)-methyltransferase n=1 Tax=Bradyrhizobium ontarionense TaxID=2898149 RepID=A0ABY3RBH5_9BRAD|nr:cobalt-precorrin-5B (C(1))-methyltransferase [Bradyrhizobium sp. A19]UFZ04719.1 cobalt-precorrin-5B (C(1))-methyltransferase [Bradyrhizobium sp. A19]